MSDVQHLVAEIRSIHNGNAWHGPSLHEALEGVTPQQAAAHPIADAHSIWELVLHIAAWETVFDQRLHGKILSEPEEGDFPPVPAVGAKAWQEAIAHLDRVHDKLLTTVSALSDDALENKVSDRDYTWRYLLHGLIRHHVYHTGQISLLAKQKP